MEMKDGCSVITRRCADDRGGLWGRGSDAPFTHSLNEAIAWQATRHETASGEQCCVSRVVGECDAEKRVVV